MLLHPHTALIRIEQPLFDVRAPNYEVLLFRLFVNCCRCFALPTAFSLARTFGRHCPGTTGLAESWTTTRINM